MKQLITLTLLVCSLFAKGQIVKQSSFEDPMPTNYTGNCSALYSPWKCIEGSTAYAHSISTLYKFSGNSSWRTEGRKGQPAVANGSYREEMTMESKGSANLANIRVMRIYMYIPSSNAPWVNEAFSSIPGFQWHPWSGSSTSGSPSFTIEILSGNFRRVFRHTNGNTTIGSAETMVTKNYGPVIYDKWIGWEMYYDPQGGATTGRVIVDRIVDGVRTTMDDYTGRVLHSWSQPPFPKIGQYHWDINKNVSTEPHIIYLDMAAYGYATEANWRSVISVNGAPPAPNQPPIVTVTNDSYPSSTAGFPLNATVTDPENQSMTYLWSQTAGGSVVLNNPTTKAASVTGATDNQTYSFQFRATDAQGGITTVSKNVSIAAAPVPPSVTMGSAQTISEGATTATITATATGTLTGGTWTQSSGPTTAGIASPNDASPNTSSTALSNLAPGTYTFKYEVISSASLKASGTVNVYVPTVNAVPQVQPAPPIVYVRSGNSGVIGCIPTDSDGPKPTVSWSQSSGPNTSTITNPTSDTTTVTGLIVGTYIYTVVGTDNKGATASALVTVQVNNPPVVDSFPGAVFTFSDTTTQVTVTGAAHDPDGSLTAYKWSAYEGPTTPTFSPDNTLSTTITNLSPGSYSVMLTVTDNDSVTSSMIYSFTIQARYLIQKFGVKKVLKH